MYLRVRQRVLKLLLASILMSLSVLYAGAADTDIVWYGLDTHQQPVIHLYFFWSKKCPHCLTAEPDVRRIAAEYPWLSLHSLELSEHADNVEAYIRMAEALKQQASSVPAFMACGQMVTGYADYQTTGRELKSWLAACYNFARLEHPDNSRVFDWASRQVDLELPLIGQLSADTFSLPVMTLVIAAMDAFNPCAFFVLLFLLSMLVHVQSRARIAFIGGLFIFCSGLMYFVFMAAWLNMFMYLGELRIMTLVAGVVAIVMAIINIKDYFWFREGISLSIPDSLKSGLFGRMRRLLNVNSLPAMLLATLVLALAANSYELLCTAGFPMVYTRLLTLSDLSVAQYYLYLLLYNLIYIVPLLFILLLFILKLGSRKLTEQEGRLLKLISGNMLLMLGLLLVTAPETLNNPWVALGLLLVAILTTWLIHKIKKVMY